jgi:hypothetical protein
LRKSALAVIGIGILFLAGYWIHRALRSDEDRIREVIGDMAAGFNACRAGAAVDGLEDGFREATTGVDRTQVHQLLVWLYFNQRDPKTKEFRYRVEIPEVNISLGDDKATAEATFQAEFSELRDGVFTPAWTTEITASLRKSDGAWKARSSRHSTVSGKRPF